MDNKCQVVFAKIKEIMVSLKCFERFSEKIMLPITVNVIGGIFKFHFSKMLQVVFFLQVVFYQFLQYQDFP